MKNILLKKQCAFAYSIIVKGKKDLQIGLCVVSWGLKNKKEGKNIKQAL